MNFNKNNRVNVVRREQKEKMITDFIFGHITKLSCEGSSASSGGNSDQDTVLCLARSPSSPVAKALLNLSKSLEEAGLRVRVIFSQVGGDTHGRSWTDIRAGLGFTRDIRLVTRAELHDAHELLVLDGKTSWVGDCLRREPAKTDAYEYYARECPSSAGNAAISFERLWRICKPVAIRQTAKTDKQAAVKLDNSSTNNLDPSMLDECCDDTEPFSATRH